MNSLYVKVSLVSMSLFSIGCNQKAGAVSDSQNTEPLPVMAQEKSFQAINEPKGENCKEGGWKYNFGVDSNKDGEIKDKEVTLTKYICNGANGASGERGVAGETGPRGPQGPAGSNGLQGPAGPQGPKGEQGAQGSIGPQGPAGAPGPKGEQGAQGSIGPQGPQGATGANGKSILPAAGLIRLSELSFVGEHKDTASSMTYVKEASLIFLPTKIGIPGAEKSNFESTGWLSLEIDRTRYCYRRSKGVTWFTLHKQKITNSKYGCETTNEDFELLNNQVFVQRESKIEFRVHSQLRPAHQKFTINLVLSALHFREN